MNDRNKIAISVIVPVFNASPYLKRCMESLINQTLKDIEIICIDDKSTDNSLEILNQYADKDKRIKVIAMAKNSGVPTVRNVGLSKAIGGYIGFVDSDDYVDLDWFNALYAKSCETDSDMAVAGSKRYRNGELTQYGGATKDIMENRFHFYDTFWQAIYRSDFLKKHSLRFDPECFLGDDTLFLNKAIFFANRLEFVENIYYHYYYEQGNNLFSKILSAAKIRSASKSQRLLAEFINENIQDPDSYAMIYARLILFNVYHMLFRAETFSLQLEAIDEAVYMWEQCRFKDQTYNLFKKKHHRHINELQQVNAYLEKRNRYKLLKGLNRAPPNETKAQKSKRKIYIQLIRIKSKFVNLF